MSTHDGAIKWERYSGTLLVYVPPVKWYQLGVPYSSELERLLRPATNHEEQAIVIAPDKVTLRYLRMESYPGGIQFVMDEREARRLAELGRYSSLDSQHHSANGYGNGMNGEYGLNGSSLNGNGTPLSGNPFPTNDDGSHEP